MNWSQFKDPVSHMCLSGTVVVPWSFTQEVAGSSHFTVMTNIFVTEFSEFSKTFKRNSSVIFIFISVTTVSSTITLTTTKEF